MKRSMDFFRVPKKNPRVQCYVDGISIPGVGSMRLSNIPKNLWNMSNLLLTLGKKAHSILFYGFALCAVGVKGDCESDPGIIEGRENLYLNYTQGDSFLWIRYTKLVDLIFLNNTCNFSVAERQSGNYTFSGCACSCKDSEGKQYYRASLFGQNLTVELVNCVQEQLKCPTSFIGYIFILFFFCLIPCASSNKTHVDIKPIKKLFAILNRRNEEKSLLNSTELLDLESRPLLNPILADEDPPVEPPAENNRWCCFRR